VNFIFRQELGLCSPTHPRLEMGDSHAQGIGAPTLCAVVEELLFLNDPGIVGTKYLYAGSRPVDQGRRAS
jgi:hypothetical protein